MRDGRDLNNVSPLAFLAHLLKPESDLLDSKNLILVTFVPNA